MPPAIPNYALGLLIALGIGLVLIGILTAVSGIWIISRQIAMSTRELAQIGERIDTRLRRQFPNIGELGD